MFEHFVTAQQSVYPQVMAELRAGAKRSHWMWFVFPQLKQLGRSATAKLYGLSDLEEARAYAAHNLLGARLRECVDLANAVVGKTALDLFGSPDDLKYRSCVTLFREATGEVRFQHGLDRFYDGAPDALTLEALR